MTERTDREWRCRVCDCLLGVERGQAIHLKYKTAEYVVTGTVTATCRRCSAPNETSCPRPSLAAPAGGAA
jgi:hypothetical protein